MTRDVIKAEMTRFSPHQHGFHFRNSQTRWSWSGVTGKFLCGGLSYASLDYFFMNMRIPANVTPPAPGTMLNEYIFQRQIDAHTFAIPTLIRYGSSSSSDIFRSGLGLDGNFGELVQSVDEGRPIPILLVDTDSPLSTSSHWTVAIGYEMDEVTPDQGGRICGKVALYDSNHPDQISYLTPNYQRTWFDHSVSGKYRTYIPNSNYRPVNLRLPRYRTAHGLPPLDTRRQNSTPFF